VDAALARTDMQASLRAFQSGHIDAATHFRAVQALVPSYSMQQIERVHEAIILGDYPDIGVAIDRIHAAGMRTACLSNTNHAHWDGQLRHSPALRRIQLPHASHLMGLVKPDAAIYRAFEASAGVRPEEVVYFDDLPEFVSAARACGWRAVLVDHTRDTGCQVLEALGLHGAPGPTEGPSPKYGAQGPE
jgi:FMN phosphatase YigB (HAD superfamily)